LTQVWLELGVGAIVRFGTLIAVSADAEYFSGNQLMSTTPRSTANMRVSGARTTEQQDAERASPRRRCSYCSVVRTVPPPRVQQMGDS
jgi:hypothetical protein